MNELQAIKKELNSYAKKRWDGALPSHISPENFSRVAYTYIANNPDLLKCDKASLWRSLMICAQLGLAPESVMGHAYLIAYGKKVQAIPGYKGYIYLAKNDPSVVDVYAHAVYENDEFEIELGTNPKLIHKPPFGKDRGEIIGAYSVIRYKDGNTNFFPIEKKDIDRAIQASPAGKKGPWSTDYETMVRKTAIRRHAPFMPLTVQKAASLEEQVETSGDQTLDADYEIVEDPKPSPAEDINQRMKADQEKKQTTKEEKPKEEKSQEPIDQFKNFIAKYQEQVQGTIGFAYKDFESYHRAAEQMMKAFKVPIDKKNIEAFEKDPQLFIDNFAEWFKE